MEDLKPTEQPEKDGTQRENNNKIWRELKGELKNNSTASPSEKDKGEPKEREPLEPNSDGQSSEGGKPEDGKPEKSQPSLPDAETAY